MTSNKNIYSVLLLLNDREYTKNTSNNEIYNTAVFRNNSIHIVENAVTSDKEKLTLIAGNLYNMIAKLGNNKEVIKTTDNFIDLIIALKYGLSALQDKSKVISIKSIIKRVVILMSIKGKNYSDLIDSLIYNFNDSSSLSSESHNLFQYLKEMVEIVGLRAEEISLEDLSISDNLDRYIMYLEDLIIATHSSLVLKTP